MDFNEHYVELRPSNVCNGVGVFAINLISKGTKIFPEIESKKYSWETITNTATRKFIEKLCNIDQDGFWLSGHPSTISIIYYVNHSSTPNVEHIGNNYIALRDIKVNEELVCTYQEDEKIWLI